MADDATKPCVECGGEMAPVVVMDKVSYSGTPGTLEYRLPGDRRSFWGGRYPTAGVVEAFLCGGCGRIALYGRRPETDDPATETE